MAEQAESEFFGYYTNGEQLFEYVRSRQAYVAMGHQGGYRKVIIATDCRTELPVEIPEAEFRQLKRVALVPDW